MSDLPEPLSLDADGASTVAEASRMLQYVNEDIVYLLADGAWRGFKTNSTAIMQRIQDAFGNPARYKVYVWYSGAGASNVQVTSL